MKWGECYFDHFQRFFRKAVDRKVFRPYQEGPSIQVLTYDGVFPGCLTFASIGLSHYEDELGGVGEVYLPVDDGWDHASYLLANALFFMVQARMPMGWGFCIGIDNILPAFEESFGKTALYFSNPIGLPKEFRTVQCEEKVGRVLLASFISRAEHEFFRQHGAVEFQKLLASKDVDTCDVRRHSRI